MFNSRGFIGRIRKFDGVLEALKGQIWISKTEENEIFPPKQTTSAEKKQTFLGWIKNQKLLWFLSKASSKIDIIIVDSSFLEAWSCHFEKCLTAAFLFSIIWLPNFQLGTAKTDEKNWTFYILETSNWIFKVLSGFVNSALGL